MTNPIPTAGDIKSQIASELYAAISKIANDPELLCIIGSYGDTLEDQEVLSCLRTYNETGLSMQPILRANPPGKPKLKLVKSDD